MSKEKVAPISLRILDKEYVLACPEDERAVLLAAAEFLNSKVKQVRDGGKVVSNERIVAVSALNIAHEYLQYKQEQENQQRDNQAISDLQNKITLAIDKIKQ
jgi:cell division protein ZapA